MGKNLAEKADDTSLVFFLIPHGRILNPNETEDIQNAQNRCQGNDHRKPRSPGDGIQKPPDAKATHK